MQNKFENIIRTMTCDVYLNDDATKEKKETRRRKKGC